MRQSVVFVALFFAGCGIFTDPNDVVLRDIVEPDLDSGSVTDQASVSMEDTAVHPPHDLGVDLADTMTCGDGLLQAAETCDPMLPATSPGACPAACDDGLACTVDSLVGSAATCDAACASEPIVACVDNDGCCPGDCVPENDLDCDPNAVCGDGVVSGLEGCDPNAPEADPGHCPESPDECAPMVCNTARIIGAAQNCDAVCAYIPIVVCASGDGCCAPGCDESNDDDCASLCGNGIIEDGETCDGSCPTDCDDGDACTVNGTTGSAATCDVSCITTDITACVDGDGCCPASCDSSADDDCSASCGNGVVDLGETCDPPADCPVSCDDADACTIDAQSGSIANCNVACTHTAVTSCRAIPDGCCPSQCNANNDFDCVPACGNGVVETPERCDGNCPQSCDDGNACTADLTTGTAAQCSRECTNTPISMCVNADGCCPAGCNAINDNDCGAVCGNAITELGELCDGTCPASCNDGNACTVDVRTGSSAQCNVSCSYSSVTSCVNADGCCPAGCNSNNDNDCSPSCGNGAVEGGETCDGNCPTQSICQSIGPCKGLSGSAAACDATCVDIVGCQTCDIGAQCSCLAAQLCDGVCNPGTGDKCDTACDPTAYCEVWFGPDSICQLADGRCIACEATCQSFEICRGPDCLDPPSCDLSPDPNAWCVAKGSAVCQGDKCVDL